MKRRLLLATLAFAALVGLLVWDTRARAAALITVNGTQVIVMTADELTAALLDMNGQKIIVLTGDEFVATMQRKDAEIDALKADLARVRKGCPET